MVVRTVRDAIDARERRREPEGGNRETGTPEGWI
jgi:hypothetical protein